MKQKKLTIGETLAEYRKRLAPLYGLPETNQFLYILFEEYCGLSKTDVHLQTNRILSGPETGYFLNALEKLENHHPVQYITGNCWFSGLQFRVSPDVLIPRPETEELTDLIARELETRNPRDAGLLDIGTGSGCIPITLKKKFPDWQAAATDISPEALGIARLNAKTHACGMLFLLSDILDRNQWGKFGSYDVIVSNPPYVTETEKTAMHRNVLDHEPHQALFVYGPDPILFYRAIAEFSMLHVKEGGSLFLEINPAFGEEIAKLLTELGFVNVQILKDIHGKNRFVRAGYR